MSLPTYDKIMFPLLRWLNQQPEAVRLPVIVTALAKEMQLTESEEPSVSNTGKSIFYDRVSWAKTYLVKGGLIDNSVRGLQKISPQGHQLLKKIESEQGLSDYLEGDGGFRAFKYGKKPASKDEVDGFEVISDVFHITQTPIEILEQQQHILNQQLRNDVLEQLKQVSPAFFEQIVVDVLVAMGYGGSHQDAAQAIGKSGDGGIDEVISEDRLGLDQVYVQAKRWEGTVGRPEIHKFKGALSDQLATKGVFITTSSFTKDAIESAKKSRIILVDGVRLAQLMIEFGVGVSVTKTYHLHKIDTDYFLED